MNIKYGEIIHIPVSTTDFISIEFLHDGDIIYTLDDIDTSNVTDYELHITLPADTVIVYDDSSEILLVYNVSSSYDKYWFFDESDDIDYPLSKIIMQTGV